jgi:hypothetical protein
MPSTCPIWGAALHFSTVFTKHLVSELLSHLSLETRAKCCARGPVVSLLLNHCHFIMIFLNSFLFKQLVVYTQCSVYFPGSPLLLSSPPRLVLPVIRIVWQLEVAWPSSPHRAPAVVYFL